MNSKCSICGKFGEVAGLSSLKILAFASSIREAFCFVCIDWVATVSDALIDKVLYRK